MRGITLITATGGRPEAFQLCYEYVRRFPWDGIKQWIVVDDGVVPSLEVTSVPGMIVTYIRPNPLWEPGQNTLARNLLLAFPEVRFDMVVFIEDDDWYHPTYLLEVARRLDRFDLVGERNAHYYYLPFRRSRVMPNRSHASLCQTAMRSELLPCFTIICRQSVNYLDVKLWEACPGRQLFDSKLCVGMKGLPGRPGLGMGHRLDTYLQMGKPDPDLRTLTEWVGADTPAYIRFTSPPSPLIPSRPL